MKKKKSFVSHFFDNKKISELKKTICTNWDSTPGHLKLLNIDLTVNSIVEVGCGIGRLLKELNNDIPLCVGFDASNSMVKEGKKYCANTSVNIIKCDGTGTLLYKSKSFEYAFSFAVFQHIPNNDTVFKYISEMYRLLKNNGKLRIQLLKNDEFPEADLWSYHDPKLICRHLSKLGFININLEEQPRWVFISAIKSDK